MNATLKIFLMAQEYIQYVTTFLYFHVGSFRYAILVWFDICNLYILCTIFLWYILAFLPIIFSFPTLLSLYLDLESNTETKYQQVLKEALFFAQ